MARGAALGALHFVNELEAEVVHASTKLANVLREHVVGNDGRDGGKQSCSRRNESFRNSRCDCAQRCGAGGAESVESVDDAPHRSEKTDERRDRSSRCEPRQATLEPSQLFRRCNLYSPLQGSETNRLWSLLSQFVICAFKHCEEWAGFELFRDGSHILQALGLTEHSHKAVALRACAAEQAPFTKNNGPGKETKDQE